MKVRGVFTPMVDLSILEDFLVENIGFLGDFGWFSSKTHPQLKDLPIVERRSRNFGADRLTELVLAWNYQVHANIY